MTEYTKILREFGFDSHEEMDRYFSNRGWESDGISVDELANDFRKALRIIKSILKSDEPNDSDDLVTVCSNCLTSSCWHGIFYCQEAKHAGTTQKTRKELRELNLEHPSYFDNPTLKKEQTK